MTSTPGPGGPHLGPAGRGPVPSAPPGPQAAGRGGAGGLCGAACSATPPPADGCRLQQRRRRPRRSACAGGWARCPQPRAWRPPRGPPPPRPPRPAQGRPRACLLARGAQPLPPPPRLPALPPPPFPRHPAVHCGTRWPSPPWPWPAGLLLARSLAGSLGQALVGAQGEREGEGRRRRRIPDSEEVTQPLWASHPTDSGSLHSPTDPFHSLQAQRGDRTRLGRSVLLPVGNPQGNRLPGTIRHECP